MKKLSEKFPRIGLQLYFYMVALLAPNAQAVETPSLTSQQVCGRSLAADFTSFWSTVYRLQGLYQQRAFNELDLSLSCLLSSEQSFSTGQSGSSAAYWFFRTQMPAPGVEPDELQRVEAWRIKFPTSVFSEFAALRLSYADAWRFRGSAYSNDVQPERFRQFTEKLSETVSLLERATPALKKTTLWHNLMLAVVQDVSSDRQRARVVFDAAVAKWPRHFDFYEVALSRFVPRWGGSWRDVDAAIREWSTRLEATEGRSMYARLYVSVLTTNGPNPSETLIDMQRMNQSLGELLHRYPAPKFAAFAVSLACFNGDKKAFDTAMQKLDLAADGPAYWIRGTDRESCVRKFVR